MPRLATVLIYDSDARERETLVYGFQGDGVKASVITSVAELPALLRSLEPQVVVATLRENDGDSLAFLKSLAQAEETRALPRLVLASTTEFPEELRKLPGSTNFIPLPAFVRDIITAAKLLVGGEARGESESQLHPNSADRLGGPGAELSGALSEYGLYFIVRTMVGLGRSGIVQVERGSRKGEIRFSEGEVVSAQVGSLQGHAALHQLLLWEEAALEIKFRPVVRLGQSLPKGDELLEDCERFLRDFSHATKNIGHAQSLFVQDAERVARLLDSIPPEVVPIMRLFDGQRCLGDVLEDSPFRVFDTLRTITRLLDMGIIRRKAIERPTTGFPGHGARRSRVDDWVRRGPETAAVGEAAATSPDEASEEQRSGLFTRRRAPRRRGGEAQPPAPDGPTEVPPPPVSPAVVMTTLPPVTAAGRRSLGSAMHGELRVDHRNQPVNSVIADVPKVVIDLGAVEEVGRGERAPPRAASVRSAEFEVGTGPKPLPSGTPGSGRPSIMVDPGLLEEADALEASNAPTPRPVPEPAPPPAPAPAPVVRPPGSATVVSFVRPAGSQPAPPAKPVIPISAVPTVPVPTVPASAAPSRDAPREPRPGEPGGERRASSEFDAVEKDFFAREPEPEPDAYQPGEAEDKDESFEDLDVDPDGDADQRGPR